MVKALASDGHRVFASMRNVDGRNAAAAETLREWTAARRFDLEVVDLDVLSEASVRAAVDYVLGRTGGRLDVVVNNAGASATGPIEAFGMDQIEELFSLNAFGPMRVCKAVLPTLRAQQSGLIIFITSTLGRVLPGRGGLYPATKWAEEGSGRVAVLPAATVWHRRGDSGAGLVPDAGGRQGRPRGRRRRLRRRMQPSRSSRRRWGPIRATATRSRIRPRLPERSASLWPCRPASGRCAPWSGRSSPRAWPSTTRSTNARARSRRGPPPPGSGDHLVGATGASLAVGGGYRPRSSARRCTSSGVSSSTIEWIPHR